MSDKDKINKTKIINLLREWLRDNKLSDESIEIEQNKLTFKVTLVGNLNKDELKILNDETVGIKI